MTQLKNYPPKPANQEETIFYCVLGEALYMVQEVESALSHSITLKKHHALNKKLADEALTKHHRNHTLGDAVRLSERENLYSLSLQKDLSNFNQKRNWLIHRVIFETRADPYMAPKKHNLFQKIKSVALDARNILHAIEQDMVDFCTSKGRDMSQVLVAMDEYNNRRQSP